MLVVIRRPAAVVEVAPVAAVSIPSVEQDELFRALEEALAEETALT